MRAEISGISLTEEDAAVAKGMLERGDRQHDIASWFGVNGGRIGEISSGKSFDNIEAQADDLPPPGPYLSGARTQKAKELLMAMREQLKIYIDEIEEQLELLK